MDVAGSPTGRRLQILIGNGDGTFRDETAQRLPQQASGQGWPYAIETADFNGDGHLDFAVVLDGADFEHAPMYLDDGSGVYEPAAFTAADPLFTIVDANGDGRPDIFSLLAGTAAGSPQLELATPHQPRLAPRRRRHRLRDLALEHRNATKTGRPNKPHPIR